ncbi:hypothetical protein E4U53_003266 [Claviceps sorghi]|nr:hypothetical protein E4U53_003266 [Claviceps sorghi]
MAENSDALHPSLMTGPLMPGHRILIRIVGYSIFFMNIISYYFEKFIREQNLRYAITPHFTWSPGFMDPTQEYTFLKDLPLGTLPMDCPELANAHRYLLRPRTSIHIRFSKIGNDFVYRVSEGGDSVYSFTRDQQSPFSDAPQRTIWFAVLRSLLTYGELSEAHTREAMAEGVNMLLGPDADTRMEEGQEEQEDPNTYQ